MGVFFGNPLHIAIAAVAVLPLALLVHLIRNVYFHPLSSIPGPKSWAATYVPYLTALFRGKLIRRCDEIHYKYGPITRVGPNEVSFAVDAAWRDIYEYRPGHKEVLKDTAWYMAPNGAAQNIVTTNDTRAHARMRKYLGFSFSDTALVSQYPVIESYAGLLISRLRALVKTRAGDNAAKDGALVEMTSWMNFFTVDVIGDLSLGESFQCLEESDYHPWVKTLFHFLQGMIYAAALRFYPWTEKIFWSLLPKSVMDLQEKHTQFVIDRIDKRLRTKTDRPDFLTPFLKHDPNFEHMSRAEIESTFCIILVAGNETSASTLSGIMNKLTGRPETLQRLTKDIRSLFTKESEINIEALKNIPYLDAVIKEGLRVCNPIPGGLPRVVPKGGGDYAGQWLPEGTKMTVRPFSIIRNEANFHRANEFCPERWLSEPERPTEFAEDKLEWSRPFSTGPNQCIGKHLAWAEMRVVIAKLVWAFDLSVDEDKKLSWDNLKAMMMVEREPMDIRLRLRADLEETGKDMQSLSEK